jgi:hypothetical protein
MAERLTIFYDQPQHRQSVVLDGERWGIRLTYRERTRSWYMDLYDADDEPVALGRRLSGDWFAVVTVVAEGGPPGGFYVVGADPYERDGVQLLYVTGDEIEAARDRAADASTLRVVLA